MILVQVYVDDIIFGSTYDQFCSRFAKLMQSKYDNEHDGRVDLLPWSSSKSKE